MDRKVRTDNLVKQLLVDGKKPENLIMLYGFVDEGSSEDTIILYLDPVLATSVEIKQDDIVHEIGITKAHSLIGGTIVWVKNANTYLQGNTAKAQQDAQQFFQGNIYEQYATAANQSNQAQTYKNTQPSVCQCGQCGS